MEDMRNYRVRWEKPVEHTLKNLGYKVTIYTIYICDDIYNIYNIYTTPQVISSPPPGSGAILASILGLGPHTTITIPVPAPLRTHTQSPPFISELCGATVRNTGL